MPRTTLTLDDDVAAGLAREVRATGRSFRTVVNDCLRAGMEQRSGQPAERFRVEPQDLDIRPGIDLDDIEGLLEAVEGTERR